MRFLMTHGAGFIGSVILDPSNKRGNLYFKVLKDFLALQKFSLIAQNMGWLFIDKFLRLGVGFFVGIWVMRYLQPDFFGQWNYAMAFAGVFATFSTLGLDSIVVHELVKNPNSTQSILGTSFALKVFAAAICILIILVTAYFIHPNNSLLCLLIALSSFAFLFQATSVFDLFFQANTQAKYTVYAGNIAFIFSTVLKITFILLKASVWFFALASLIEVILTAIFSFTIYERLGHSVRKWTFDKKLARELLGRSWPFMLSGFVITIYMRIDQIMLGQMLNSKVVGEYSAALKLSELWYIVPTAVATSLFPTIISNRETNYPLYLKRMQAYYSLMTWMALIPIIFITFLAAPLVIFLYGKEYEGTAPVLALHIWTALFVFFGVAKSRWIVMEGMQNYFLVCAAIGAFVNVALNFFLIPHYGGSGAALATLLAQMTSNVFISLFYKKDRINLIMFFKSFNPFFMLKVFNK